MFCAPLMVVLESYCWFHLICFNNYSSLIVSASSSSCCSEISKVSRPIVSSFSRSLVSWIWASASWTLPIASFAWSERVLISYFLSLMVSTRGSCWLDEDMNTCFCVKSVAFVQSRQFLIWTVTVAWLLVATTCLHFGLLTEKGREGQQVE